MIDLCGPPPQGKQTYERFSKTNCHISNHFLKIIKNAISTAPLLSYCVPFKLLFTGTGLQNLRECILWTQTKHDFEPKRKKPFWRQMSVNFIERYCYLICFATYVKLFAPRGNLSIRGSFPACSISVE